MARIQHSIEVNVPVQTLYNQLTQFEAYPSFWEKLEKAEQIDDVHLHWTAKSANVAGQWESEIVEQKPDECIVWRDTSGPGSGGRVEVQALSPYSSKAVFSLDAEPGQFSGLVAGDTEETMTQCLAQSLNNLKVFIETLELETGAWRGEIEDGNVTIRGRDGKDRVRQTSGQRSPASDGGSPTEVLDDEPNEAGFGNAYSKVGDSSNQPPGKSDRGIAR